MSDYQSRLSLMEGWYEELVASDEREQLLLQDYEPHRQFLGSLSGSVVDIGGGAGLAARFLRSDVDYVVVDPSELWRSREWIEFGAAFRKSGPEPRFIAADGEALPFPDGRFDAALSLWSLNHVRDPGRCLVEMARVLKPGGCARLVLEDIEPSWPDLLNDGAARVWARVARIKRQTLIRRPLIEAFSSKMRGDWPLHEDHIRIPEPALREWMGDCLTVKRREWIDGSLTFDLVKSGD